MDCGGCELKSGLEGVEAMGVDMRMQVVTVRGHADETHVLNTLKITGKEGILWPYAYSAEYGPYAAANHSYHNQLHAPPDSNGKVEGCDGPPPSSSAMVDSAVAFFSDENPHACSLM